MLNPRRRLVSPGLLLSDPCMFDRFLYYLKLTREAEYRIDQVLYRQGKIVGGCYVGRGQEGITVGATIQLGKDDVVVPTHRDFAAYLIRGFSLSEIYCAWLGRANGPTRGKDASLHFGDMKRGVVGIISHLGSWCPVACGVALAMKLRKKPNVVVVFFGEGATSEGDVHEAMNLASVMKLPVIFVCNNNGYAYSTLPEKGYAIKDLARRAEAYAMPGVAVDGNDVLAVYAAVEKAIGLARKGGGPSVVECKTFRMTGHAAHDDASYVPAELFKKWAKKDPIERLQKHMIAKRLITPAGVAELEKTIRREVDDALAFAEASALPEGSSAAEGVYCGPECRGVQSES